MGEITIKVDELELWEAVWGSDGSGVTYWCDQIRKPDGSDIELWLESPNGYLIGNPQDFKLRMADIEDIETMERTWYTITMADLVAAYGKAVANGESHCGMKLDIDDADECFGDIVLQYACFGEMVYG